MSVILISAVLLILSGGVYFIATREGRMSQADYVGGQAFYYAEGGLETTLNFLNFYGTESQLTRPMNDQSPDGYGYLMDPNASNRQNPSNPVQMKIGNESFTVFVDEVKPDGNGGYVHCSAGDNCGLNLLTTNPSYLMVTAEGNAGAGFHTVQQTVELRASTYPLDFYINGDATCNGTTSLTNQSIYVKGNFLGRDKLTLSGTDLMTGEPAGVFATGTIYAKANGSCPIYNSDGSRNTKCYSSNDANDRDKNGPAWNTFTASELNDLFDTSGLTVSQLSSLRAQAKAYGNYWQPSSGSFKLCQQGTSSCDGQVKGTTGDTVVFVEYSSGNPASNQVSLDFGWPVSGTGQAIIVILNGGANMEGSNSVNTLNATIYAPNGVVTLHGSGQQNFVGFVFGGGLNDIGNYNVQMTQQFMDNPPFFAWTVTRETSWIEVDR